MKRLRKLAVAAVMAAALPAFAAPVVGLGFEDMQVQSANGIFRRAQVWEFYSGGYSRSQDGQTNLVLGPDNFGVPFSSSALAIMSASAKGTGPFGPRYLDVQGGTPLPDSGISALFFTDNSPVLNYSDGFDVGFSFYYASTAEITVTLYEGLDARGSELGKGSFSLTPTCTINNNTYCVWSIGKVAFTGTARSAKLGGLDNQALFDNVTFGSLTPIDGAIPVPEPSSFALVAIGLMGVGWTARRRRLAA